MPAESVRCRVSAIRACISRSASSRRAVAAMTRKPVRRSRDDRLAHRRRRSRATTQRRPDDRSRHTSSMRTARLVLRKSCPHPSRDLSGLCYRAVTSSGGCGSYASTHSRSTSPNSRGRARACSASRLGHRLRSQLAAVSPRSLDGAQGAPPRLGLIVFVLARCFLRRPLLARSSALERLAIVSYRSVSAPDRHASWAIPAAIVPAPSTPIVADGPLLHAPRRLDSVLMSRLLGTSAGSRARRSSGVHQRVIPSSRSRLSASGSAMSPRRGAKKRKEKTQKKKEERQTKSKNVRHPPHRGSRSTDGPSTYPAPPWNRMGEFRALERGLGGVELGDRGAPPPPASCVWTPFSFSRGAEPARQTSICGGVGFQHHCRASIACTEWKLPRSAARTARAPSRT